MAPPFLGEPEEEYNVPIIWIPTKNHTKGIGRVAGVIVHSTRSGIPNYDREYEATVNWFLNSSGDKAVSAHYVVDRKDNIAQMVNLRDTAWHAGQMNTQYIGIELCQSTYNEPYTDFQYRHCARLIKEAQSVHGFQINATTILGHEDTWQGKSLGKSDPGAVFNWEKLFNLLRS